VRSLSLAEQVALGGFSLLQLGSKVPARKKDADAGKGNSPDE
jgi:hypothetical protein